MPKKAPSGSHANKKTPSSACLPGSQDLDLNGWMGHQPRHPLAPKKKERPTDEKKCACTARKASSHQGRLRRHMSESDTRQQLSSLASACLDSTRVRGPAHHMACPCPHVSAPVLVGAWLGSAHVRTRNIVHNLE